MALFQRRELNMYSTHAAHRLVLAAYALAALVACGDRDGSPDVENPAVQSYLSPQSSSGGVVCPSADSGDYHGKATSAFAYVMGGNDPFTIEELDTRAECAASHDCLALLRDAVVAGRIAVNPAKRDRVCGVDAAVRRLDFDAALEDEEIDSIAMCGSHLDACWGSGVSGFFYAD